MMLYEAYQGYRDLTVPVCALATSSLPALNLAVEGPVTAVGARELAALAELTRLATLRHRRPDFRIAEIVVGDDSVKVTEQVAHRTAFGTLLHFRKASVRPAPRVLIVAPMSGHFATLLRETARTMLSDHDVFLTDWHNARDVPLTCGRFGLDEYVEHIIEFLGVMGPPAHVVAVCQPCVAALAATAIMAEDDHPATPASLTLMAGPIDCRIAPTRVNELAATKPIDWFERNLVAIVPLRYRGALRSVYPGFLQLTAFMNMNLERHVDAFKGYYADLVNGETERAEATRTFYEEYFAVADLPARFYLDTVRYVFQECALANHQLRFRGRPVNPAALRRTFLLTVEGERDDICSLGQTMAAHELCTGLRSFMRSHYMQVGVGHYGVFSGRRWNASIYPVVRDTIDAAR